MIKRLISGRYLLRAAIAVLASGSQILPRFDDKLGQ